MQPELLAGVIGGAATLIAVFLTELLRRRGKRPSSGPDVELVDASLDPHILHSPGSTKDTDRYVSELSYTGKAIDFKFVNRGDSSAFVREVAVEVVEFTLDKSPVLHLRCDEGRSEPNPVLSVQIENSGWGDAREVCCTFTDPVLTSLFPSIKLDTPREVKSRQVADLTILKARDIDRQALQVLIEARATQRQPLIIFVQQRQAADSREATDDDPDLLSEYDIAHELGESNFAAVYVSLDTKIEYTDEDGSGHSEHGFGPELWASSQGFFSSDLFHNIPAPPRSIRDREMGYGVVQYSGRSLGNFAVTHFPM